MRSETGDELYYRLCRKSKLNKTEGIKARPGRAGHAVRTRSETGYEMRSLISVLMIHFSCWSGFFHIWCVVLFRINQSCQVPGAQKQVESQAKMDTSMHEITFA